MSFSTITNLPTFPLRASRAIASESLFSDSYSGETNIVELFGADAGNLLVLNSSLWMATIVQTKIVSPRIINIGNRAFLNIIMTITRQLRLSYELSAKPTMRMGRIHSLVRAGHVVRLPYLGGVRVPMVVCKLTLTISLRSHLAVLLLKTLSNSFNV